MLTTRYFVLLSLLTAAAFGQSFTGGIIGNVQDPSGAAIPDATIVAINISTNVRTETRSDTSGKYALTQLAPGPYQLEASVAGFKKFVRTGIELAVQQQPRIDVTMAVGEVSDSVTVAGEISTIETSTSTMGKVVSNRAILNLPLNSRNIYSLIYLTPGVAGSIGTNYNSMSYSVNGSRTSVMEILIDGATATHPTVQGYTGVSAFPSVDAIGEFKVMGSNFSSEYGRTQGSVLNVVYKSGTNQYHGSAYEFLRNSVLDANNYFSNARGIPLSSFKRSQYGATMGGPVIKDKTFFMASYEGLRQRSFSSKTLTVPTDLERSGDFSQTFAANRSQVLIFDPFATSPNPSGPGTVRAPFAGNVIPQNRILTASQNILKYMPKPNTAGAAYTNANNYYQQGSGLLDIDQIDGRFDHNFTQTQRMFIRVSKRNQDDEPAVLWPTEIGMAEDRINQRNRMYNGVLDYTNAVNPTTVIGGRLAFARSLYFYENQGLDFKASSLGLPSYLDTAGGLTMFPHIAPAGYAPLGNTDNRYNVFMTYTAAASVTRIQGAHSWKAGYEGRLIRVNNRESRSTSGDFSFGTSFTQGPVTTQSGADRGNGLASMLLGTGTGNLIQSFKDAAAQSFYTGLYFQDDWRVTNRLTLNLGVRYDLDTPRTERFDRMNYLDPTIPSPLAQVVPGFSNLRGGLVFVNTNGQPRSQYKTDRNNFAPRIGLAWQMNDKTTIRAAWGNFYGISPQQAHGTVGPFGFRTQTDWLSAIGDTPKYSFANPFPDGFTTPPGSSQGLLTQAGANLQAPFQDTVTPYSSQWNFNVQRNLPGQILLEMAYVGTRGLQLSRNDESGLDINQLDPQYMAMGPKLLEQVDNPFYNIVKTGVLSTAKVTRGQLLRPYPQFTNMIPLYSSGSSSTYHALQISFSKRFSKGVQFEGSYVKAKSIDNGMSHANSYDIRNSRALTTYDVPQRFVVSGLYELPFGKGRKVGANWNRGINAAAGGWQLQGIVTLQSGTPLTITANNVSNLNSPRGLANNNGTSAKLEGDIHDRLLRFFDTSVFSQPAAYTMGNTSPSIADLRAPGTNSSDLSVFKDFLMTERFRLQFRTEAFNAFNTVRFSAPNTSVVSSSFGQITTQANSPRQVQLSLKLLW